MNHIGASRYVLDRPSRLLTRYRAVQTQTEAGHTAGMVLNLRYPHAYVATLSAETVLVCLCTRNG